MREIAALFARLPSAPTPADWERVAGELVREAEQRVADLTARLEDIGSGATLCDLGAALDG